MMHKLPNNIDIDIMGVVRSYYCETVAVCKYSYRFGICRLLSHTGLEKHFAQIESDLVTLSIMLNSPHSVELRPQIEDYMYSLQDLGRIAIQKKKCENESISLYIIIFINI